jgi:cyclopropane-fatty-acyl-phospholipid synthase
VTDEDIISKGENLTRRADRGLLVSEFIAKGLLSRIKTTSIEVADAKGLHRYGPGRPSVSVAVHDARTFAATLRGGSAGLGSSYADGWWDCEDLTGFLQVLIRELSGVGRVADRWSRRLALFDAPLRRLRPSRRERDRANIRAHYDLSNQFFELMLDETMAYSCALFESPTTSLADASRAKFDRLCRRLELGPDDHLLEIGTGWGGLALHAAKNYGCRVTTTTISDAQFEYASRRVRDEGLSSLITVLNEDYRDLQGTYDKVVSVEMIEAIGWRQLDTFFTTCARLLRPEGLMALQAIVIDDRSYERAKHSDDFIKEFIFPGGFLPSVEAMIHSMTTTSDLRIIESYDIGRHYAETLRRWRENLLENDQAVHDLDLGMTFSRLWHFYLCYCEAAFLERHVSDVQLVLARERWRGSLHSTI